MSQPDPQPLHVGYVLKRFPRTSETFIAQEILELERRGVRASVFTLIENDQPAQHAWLRELSAPVVHCPPISGAALWNGLRERITAKPGAGSRSVRRALDWALETERGRRDLAQAMSVAMAARAGGVDRLHAHFANRPAVVALLAHALSGFPFSITAHAKDIFAAGPSPRLWRRLARHADFVAAVSEATRDHLVDRLGERSDSTFRLLYNGVDLDTIRPGQRRPDGVLRLVCVARQVPKKGLGDLLMAASLLRERGVPFTCTIIGDGPEHEKLLRMQAEHRLEKCVSFEGSLSHEHVVEHLRASDAVVLPCRVLDDGDRDVLPTVLLEGMAAGLACVSTPVGGVPEIIEHGESGLIVPERDPGSLAEALDTLGRDPVRTSEMGMQGRRLAEQRFDRRATVATLHRWLADPHSSNADRARAPRDRIGDPT